MDKAVIIGVYEFIGFHLCLTLLEKGIEVRGIHIPSSEEDPFLEEKRLTIGRNSNYCEEDHVSFREEEEDTVYFIDYYSFYMKRQEKQLAEWMNGIVQENIKQRMVVTLPIQMVGQKEKTNHPHLLNVNNGTRIFYLPTIYGPWQPLHFLFQQVLKSPNEFHINDREYTEDALYIGDVIPTILKHIDKGYQGPYLLKSKITNHWKRITEQLVEKEFPEEKKLALSSKQEVVFLSVDGLPIKEAIENQRNHLTKLGVI